MELSRVKQVLIEVLILNWLVAIAKILIGFSTGALSILADGFHSFFDGFSNILGLAGVKIAERPKDFSHPYGHQKFEALAALGIAFLILITGYEFLRSTIERFLHPSVPKITPLSFLVILAALIVDFFVYRYENQQGKKMKSTILIVDSLHTKTHFFTTPSVILGMIAIKAGFPIFDPIITALVILMLGKLAWGVIKQTIIVLCDAVSVNEREIQEIVSGVEGIKSSHHIRTRGDSHCVFLDMHITLNPNLSLKEAHNISHQLKEKIMKRISEIKDVVIHLEPEGPGDARENKNLL